MTIKQEIEQKLLNDIRTKKEIISIVGAFGDVENCEGYIENVSTPPEGGIFVKFYGCSYLFKGWPKNEIVEGLGLAKSMFSVLPRAILGRSRILQLFLIFMFLFRKENLIHWFHVISTMIYGHVTNKVNFPKEKYNSCVREMMRAANESLRKWDETILTRDREKLAFQGVSTNRDEKDGTGNKEKRKLLKAVSQTLEFFWLFIEHDNAYRFPLQDILPELNKENLKKNPKKEILRLFDVCISRATSEGILDKARQMRRLVSLFLFFSSKKTIRGIQDFFQELDLDKVKLDEHDYYFSLNRKGYNMKGISYEERLRMKYRIDRAKNHYRLQLVDIKIPNEKLLQAFKVLSFEYDIKNLDPTNSYIA